MSVKSHLTSGASVRPENAVTYSAGNEGQKICGVFSETAPLQRSSTPSVDGHTYSRPFFLRKALTHAHYSMGLAAPPPSVFPVPAYIPLPPLASLPLPLAAQRNGGKRMCQSGLPADAASLRETGSVDRYTPPVGPCPIELRSLVANCGAVSCLIL